MATFSGPNYVAQFDASKLLAQMSSGAERGVLMAGAALQRQQKVMLSKPGPGGGRTLGSIFKQKSGPDKGKTEVVRASAPGEPPRYRTRDLLNSIQMIREGAAAVRVGTHLMYGLYLELGTAKMAARPWLRTSLVIMQDEIARLILSGMKGKA